MRLEVMSLEVMRKIIEFIRLNVMLRVFWKVPILEINPYFSSLYLLPFTLYPLQRTANSEERKTLTNY